MKIIYTTHGEPVEIVSARCYDLLNPVTLAVPAYEVRSLNDPTWKVVRMMHELKADGGVAEIDAAFKAADAKYAKPESPSTFTLYARREEEMGREECGLLATLDEACNNGDALLADGWYEYFVYDKSGKQLQHVCGE